MWTFLVIVSIVVRTLLILSLMNLQEGREGMSISEIKTRGVAYFYSYSSFLLMSLRVLQSGRGDA